MPKLADVSHVSKRGSSLRITLPKRIAEILGAGEHEVLENMKCWDSMKLMGK